MRFHPLFVLLLAYAVAMAGCEPARGELPPAKPTVTATSAQSASRVPTAPAAPAASPGVYPSQPAGGHETPAPAGPTPGRSSTSAPPTATPPSPASSPTAAAVRTVLDYFDAINQQDYGKAYGYWAESGAASGQTRQQFASGYSSTVRVTVLLGTPSFQRTDTAGQVVVPVTIMSVVNLPGDKQQVQRYQGTYTLRPAKLSGASEWEIAAASVAQTTAGTLPPAEVADPTTLLSSYFDAINSREFARAYTYWNNLGQASQQSFAQFEQGFATTRQVKVELGKPQEGAAAGNIYADVPVTIVATQDDGITRTYSGTYTTHRANVPPFDQLGWRIEGAKVAQTASSPGR